MGKIQGNRSEKIPKAKILWKRKKKENPIQGKKNLHILGFTKIFSRRRIVGYLNIWLFSYLNIGNLTLEGSLAIWEKNRNFVFSLMSKLVLVIIKSYG